MGGELGIVETDFEADKQRDENPEGERAAKNRDSGEENESEPADPLRCRRVRRCDAPESTYREENGAKNDKERFSFPGERWQTGSRPLAELYTRSGEEPGRPLSFLRGARHVWDVARDGFELASRGCRRALIGGDLILFTTDIDGGQRLAA